MLVLAAEAEIVERLAQLREIIVGVLDRGE